MGDSGSCRPRNARCATTGTPNTGLFQVPPGRTRPPEGGPGVPPRATPPQNPGRRRAGLAEGKRPSARTSVPATPRPGTPSSNPEGLSGVVRQARTYCGWHTTGQESLPPSRRTRVTIFFGGVGGGGSGNCHQGPDHKLPRGSLTGTTTTVVVMSGPGGPVLKKEGRGTPNPRPHCLRTPR